MISFKCTVCVKLLQFPVSKILCLKLDVRLNICDRTLVISSSTIVADLQWAYCFGWVIIDAMVIAYCRKFADDGTVEVPEALEPEDVAEACMLAVRTSSKCFPGDITLWNSMLEYAWLSDTGTNSDVALSNHRIAISDGCSWTDGAGLWAWQLGFAERLVPRSLISSFYVRMGLF